MNCGKRTLKSFEQLNQLVQAEAEIKKQEEDRLNKRLALVGNICIKTETLKTAQNGILGRVCTYEGRSSVIKAVCECGKVQVSKILDAALKYVNSNKQDISELKTIDKALDSLIEESARLDKIAADKEKKRLEIEKKRRKEAEEKRRRRAAEEERINREERERKKLEEALDNRKIKRLFHFTRIENLDSILKDGIIPRKDLIQSNSHFIYNDDGRWDSMTSCSCLSVEFPNTWVLHKKMDEIPNSGWAIIALDAKLLLEQKNFYAVHNAAARGVSPNTSVEAFEKMFDNVIMVERATGAPLRFERENLQSYLPTSDQAEILVKGIIKPQFIKKIYFQNERSAKRFEEQLDNQGIEGSVNLTYFMLGRKDIGWEKR